MMVIEMLHKLWYSLLIEVHVFFPPFAISRVFGNSFYPIPRIMLRTQAALRGCCCFKYEKHERKKMQNSYTNLYYKYLTGLCEHPSS